MLRTDRLSGGPPMPGTREVGSEGARVEKSEGGDAPPDKLLLRLRGESTGLDRSSTDYDTILDQPGDPLSARTVSQAHGHDDLLVEKLVLSQEDAEDLDVERAVSLASDTAVLDQVVDEVSGGHIPKLSEEVSPETLKAVKGDVADAVRGERHGPEQGELIGRSHDKRSPLDMVRSAVSRTIDRIRDAIVGTSDRPPVESAASERVRPVVDRVKAFSAERLNAKLYASGGSSGRLEQQVLRDMGAEIGRLDNTGLLKLYRTTLSADMQGFRLTLANRQDDPMARLLLEDLNSYEAMVHMEVIERSAQRPGEVDDFQLLDHGPKLGQLGALAGTEKRAADRDMAMQSDSYLRGEDTVRTAHPGAVAKLAGTGLSPNQVGDALRSADLTVNVGPGLFVKGGPFRDENGALRTDAPRLKNIYELPQKKGPDYLQRRQMIEHGLEPATERADRTGVDADNHPISAGLNIGQRIAGSASGYGGIVLVLKDSVKDRCTFTAVDSFKAFEARVTPENVALYKARVAELLGPHSSLPDATRQALLDHPTALTTFFTELDNLVGQDFGAHRPFLDLLEAADGPMREIDPGQVTLLKYRLQNLAIDTFMERPGGGHVTTPERMAHMIADFNQNVVDPIATGVRDERRINLPVNNYIEAQVYGGIDLANDVAEIRFFEKDVGTLDAAQKQEYLDSVEGLRQIARDLGVRVVRYKPEEAQLPRPVADLDMPVPPSFPALQGAAQAAKIGSLAEFRQTELPALLDSYQNHEQSFDPTGINGRRHVGRALIYANVMANIVREKGGEVDSNALYTATALHDAGRHGSGADMWEKDSARVASGYLRGRGIDDERYLGLVEAAVDGRSDPSMKSLEAGILKSADSLDSMRLVGKDAYATDNLWFQHQDVRLGQDAWMGRDEELRTALVDEIAAFIEATEPETPSERELAEARQHLTELGVELLKPVSPERRTELEQEHQRLTAHIGDLNEQVDTEHREMNAGLSSGALFAQIESELLDNPDKYPTLARYYDPTR